MKIIYTKSGVGITVSDSDYPALSKYAWHISPQGYAKRNKSKIASGSPYTLMHRMILGLQDKDKMVDHINGNKLDNRRENLRIVSNQGNQANSKIPKNNTSGYKGVTWDKYRNKWIAQIMVNRRHKYLGRFESIEDAVVAYDTAALLIFGNCAYTNKEIYSNG